MIWGCCSLVWSRFSHITWPKNEVICLPEYTEWPGYSINRFISSLRARACCMMTMPGSVGLKLWKSGSGSLRHFHLLMGHDRVQTWTPIRTFLGCAEEDCEQRSESPIVNTRSCRKINADINVVALQKLEETMPQRTCAVAKGKGGPIKCYSMWPFLDQAV